LTNIHENTIRDALERYRAGVEYLVMLALSGRYDVLEALRLYAEGLSPNQIARVFKVNKHTAVSWVHKLCVCTRPAYAPLLIRRILPLLRDVKPIVEGYTCILCRRTFNTRSSIAVHVLLKHKDLITSYTKQVLAKLGDANEPEGEGS
jgi:transposase-like protein